MFFNFMKKLENYRLCVKVKENINQMITTLEQNIKDKRSNFSKSDLNKYVVYKNQITEYPKRLWFKGSRYR